MSLKQRESVCVYVRACEERGERKEKERNREITEEISEREGEKRTNA